MKDSDYLTSAPLTAESRAKVDADWVQRIRETATGLRNNSFRLAQHPGMEREARARQLAALYIEEIAALHEDRIALSKMV